jgi:hypothetical protein
MDAVFDGNYDSPIRRKKKKAVEAWHAIGVAITEDAIRRHLKTAPASGAEIEFPRV